MTIRRLTRKGRLTRIGRSTMSRVIAVLAAATLSTTAAYAQPDKGQGKGGGKSADQGQGKGGGKSADQGQSGNGGKDKGPKGDPGNNPRKFDGRSDRQVQSDKPGKEKFDKGRREARDDRFERQDGDALRDNDRQFGRRGFDDQSGFAFRRENRRLTDGCPPGLAKKFNGCMPPGLAKNDFRNAQRSFDRADWWGLTALGGSQFFFDDGYLLRLNDGGQINGYLPLLGGALAIGNLWPSDFQPTALAPYYVDYFGLGSDDAYRFANDVIYRVNPQTTQITSIAALLTGDQFRAGSQMPAGYDVYNVPYAYRDRYSDQADARFRYSDGYIYQVDPTTNLIASVISLIL